MSAPLPQSPTQGQAGPTPFAFLDFEASSLSPESWPIEWGVARCDAPVASGLIAPAPTWPDKAWSLRSAGVHKISRGSLASADPPHRALTRLEAAVRGALVFSDAPDFDNLWLARLAEAAGRPPAFGILDWTLALGPALRHPLFPGIVDSADRRAPRTHRAGPDARHMLEVYLMSRALA
jgi:hypothetical protein